MEKPLAYLLTNDLSVVRLTDPDAVAFLLLNEAVGSLCGSVVLATPNEAQA